MKYKSLYNSRGFFSDYYLGTAFGRGHRGKSALLMKTDIKYGLLITGDRMRLVRSLSEGPKGAFFEFDIESCLELNDIDSLTIALEILSSGAFNLPLAQK